MNWKRALDSYATLTIIGCVVFVILAIGANRAIGQALDEGATPTPWPQPEVPGAIDIQPAVSRFDTNLGTRLLIVEGTTARGTPFICAIYVQYDTDPIQCQFPDLVQSSTFLPLAGQ